MDKLSLVFVLVVNTILKVFYFFVYKNLFFYFLLFFVFLDIVVVICYLRYLSYLKFEGDKIFYRRFFFKYRFFFSDIISIEKKLMDKMLILTLNNKLKIKIYYSKENHLEDFYTELKNKRNDLFILKDNEIPVRYYISYFYVLMLILRVMLSFIAYYISFKNVLIFMFILLTTFNVVLRYIFVFWDLVFFYEFKKDFIFEKKFFSSKKYYYKFFEEILIKSKNINDDIYFYFLYKKNKRICIEDSKRIYSMQKAFKYIIKYV